MESINTEKGEYRILFDGRGALAPAAKERIRAAAALGADFIYGDEAYPGKNGWIPVRKPDEAPDTLLSYNCIGMPLALPERMYHALGGMADGSAEQRYLFTLRAAGHAAFFFHIPEILYYGAKKPEPLPGSRAICRALSDASCGVAMPGSYPGSFAVRYGLRDAPRVSIICVLEHAPDALRATLESVVHDSSFLDCNFVIATGGVPDGRAKTYLDALEKTRAARVVYAAQGGNRAELMNLGAKAACGDVFLFLDAGITLGAHDAIERLISHATRKNIGAAGGKIVSRGRIAHAGLTFGIGQTPESLYFGETDALGAELKNQTVFTQRNVSAVSGALCMLAATFRASRGFDETFPRAGAEAELCLRLMRAGYRSVYDPLALFRLPELPAPAILSDENRQRLTDVFRVFSKEGDPMLGRGAWLNKDAPGASHFNFNQTTQ